MRKLHLIVLCLAMVAMLVACGEAEKKADESADVKTGETAAPAKIVLGVAGAHSGDLASYGLPSVNAAKLVAAKLNAAGGVNGAMVEVVAQDDQCKPELATNAATKMVSEEITIVLGHICSGATKAAMPIYLESDRKSVV